MKAGLITRLALIEAALHPEDQWWKTEGLCAILEYAKRLPPRDLDDLDDLPLTGMGRLLQEAKAQLKAQEHEA